MPAGRTGPQWYAVARECGHRNWKPQNRKYFQRLAKELNFLP